MHAALYPESTLENPVDPLPLSFSLIYLAFAWAAMGCISAFYWIVLWDGDDPKMYNLPKAVFFTALLGPIVFLLGAFLDPHKPVPEYRSSRIWCIISLCGFALSFTMRLYRVLTG